MGSQPARRRRHLPAEEEEEEEEAAERPVLTVSTRPPEITS